MREYAQYFYMYFGENYLISERTCQLSPYLCECPLAGLHPLY